VLHVEARPEIYDASGGKADDDLGLFAFEEGVGLRVSASLRRK
jgi:hypothetical protein